MKQVSEGIARGIKKSARPLTKSLRSAVIESGWTSELAQQLKIQSDGSSFTLPSDSEEISDMEYGTLDRLPSGAIHKWSSDTVTVESIILDTVSTQLQGVV